jgi:hypothetical protein
VESAKKQQRDQAAGSKQEAERIEHLEADKEDLNGKLAHCRDDGERKGRDLDQARRDLSKAEQKAKEKEDAMDRWKKGNKDLEGKLEVADGRNKELEKEIEDMRKRIRELEEELGRQKGGSGEEGSRPGVGNEADAGNEAAGADGGVGNTRRPGSGDGRPDVGRDTEGTKDGNVSNQGADPRVATKPTTDGDGSPTSKPGDQVDDGQDDGLNEGGSTGPKDKPTTRPQPGVTGGDGRIIEPNDPGETDNGRGGPLPSDSTVGGNGSQTATGPGSNVGAGQCPQTAPGQGSGKGSGQGGGTGDANRPLGIGPDGATDNGDTDEQEKLQRELEELNRK